MTPASPFRPSVVAAVLLPMLCACDASSPGTGAAASDSAARTAHADAPAPTRGLDSLLLARAYEQAAELPRLHSLLVARHGDIVREEYFGGRMPTARANIKSASKSVISALVGIAIVEGHLEGIDQSIAPFFPEHATAVDPRLAGVTIGHLLSMQSGLEPTSFGSYGSWVGSGNWVRYVLTRPFVDEPGGGMLYSTGSSHLLSAILTRATGMSTLEYARTRIFRPLDIELAAWTRDPQGIYFGGNEMHLRPRELLAFAELYRNGGRHDGAQVVPEAWIRESWVQRTSSRFNSHGYGMGWWMRSVRGHDVYFAWGYGGQYAFIVPDLELTVVTTSDALSPREGGHNRSIHRMIDDLLIPAAVQGSRRYEAPGPS